MSAAVSLSIAVFLAALAVWGLALAALGRRPDRTYLIAVLVAEVELVLQAAVALAVVIAGHETESLGEFLGYLVVSVALVPFGLNRARAPEATRFDSAVLGIICIAVGVAVIRLLSLW